jgi:hypothetical protein
VSFCCFVVSENQEQINTGKFPCAAGVVKCFLLFIQDAQDASRVEKSAFQLQVRLTVQPSFSPGAFPSLITLNLSKPLRSQYNSLTKDPIPVSFFRYCNQARQRQTH